LKWRLGAHDDHGPLELPLVIDVPLLEPVIAPPFGLVETGAARTAGELLLAPLLLLLHIAEAPASARPVGLLAARRRDSALPRKPMTVATQFCLLLAAGQFRGAEVLHGRAAGTAQLPELGPKPLELPLPLLLAAAAAEETAGRTAGTALASSAPASWSWMRRWNRRTGRRLQPSDAHRDLDHSRDRIDRDDVLTPVPVGIAESLDVALGDAWLRRMFRLRRASAT
jgi:hypothetical protein